MTEPGDSFEDRLRAGLTYGADGAPAAAGLAAGARTRAGVRRRRRIAAGAAVAVALVAVPAAVLAGGGDRRADDSGPAGPGDLLGDVEVTCGPDSARWPVSVMDGGVPSPSIDEETVRDAFRLTFGDDRVEAPEAIRRDGVDAASYIVLAEDATGATLGVGEWTAEGPGADGDYVHLDRGLDGEWRGAGWGDCTLERALPDGQARVAVVAPEGGVDPTSTEVTVLVNELQCAGGRSVLPHLGDPEVLADDEQVIVTLTSDQIAGAATCEAREPEEHTLHLDEPIGDREFRDGGTWPPTPIEVADSG